jgi:hypothetical protein
MTVKVFSPAAGTVLVEVNGERVLLSLQDLTVNSVYLQFPLVTNDVSIDPPLTGLITPPP